MALCGSRATDAIDGDEAPTLSAMRTRLLAATAAVVLTTTLAACKNGGASAGELPETKALGFIQPDIKDQADPAVGTVTDLGHVTVGGSGFFVFAWVTKAGKVCFDRVAEGGGSADKGCDPVPSSLDIEALVTSRCTTIAVYGQVRPDVVSVELEAGRLVASAPVVDLGTTNGVLHKAYLVSLNTAATTKIEASVTAKDAKGAAIGAKALTGSLPAGDC